MKVIVIAQMDNIGASNFAREKYVLETKRPVVVIGELNENH